MHKYRSKSNTFFAFVLWGLPPYPKPLCPQKHLGVSISARILSRFGHGTIAGDQTLPQSISINDTIQYAHFSDIRK